MPVSDSRSTSAGRPPARLGLAARALTPRSVSVPRTRRRAFRAHSAHGPAPIAARHGVARANGRKGGTAATVRVAPERRHAPERRPSKVLGDRARFGAVGGDLFGFPSAPAAPWPRLPARLDAAPLSALRCSKRKVNHVE
jgi:hypothetical protein